MIDPNHDRGPRSSATIVSTIQKNSIVRRLVGLMAPDRIHRSALGCASAVDAGYRPR
jgi:hypothetical protein